MAYLDAVRDLPELPRLILGLALAAIFPAALFFWFLTGTTEFLDGFSGGKLRETLLSLFVMVGQSYLLAVPVGLDRWPRMTNPLRECITIGAATAPGPIGYVGILLLLMFNVVGTLISWLALALMGALGGFIFWCVVTNLGRQTFQLNTE